VAKNPYLAIFRSGANSLHPHAVAKLERQNFDYALSHFADNEPYADGAVFVDRQKGPKWPGLEQTILRHWKTIERYRYVWLPDDDLLCEPDLVSRMFAITSDLALDLAQPALTHDSYFTHPITLRHPAFQVRFTNFVEIMAPVLATPFLARIVPTLRSNLSGYGLDALWPRMSRLGKVAIIDDTPLKHTRPLGAENYKFNRESGVPAYIEDWLVAATSFIEAPADFHINFGGLLQSGDPIVIGAAVVQIEPLLRALLASLGSGPVDALALTRYLANHLNYCTGGEFGRARYSRDMVRVVLNQTLAPMGIKFPEPAQRSAAPAAAAA